MEIKVVTGQICDRRQVVMKEIITKDALVTPNIRNRTVVTWNIQSLGH